MSKSIIILGIICLIAASIVVGFLVWSITQPCTQPASQQQVVVEEIDISNWQTYRNEEYGFEFKYPEDLIVEDWADKTPNWELLLYIGENKNIGDGVISIGVEKAINVFDAEKILWPIPRKNLNIKDVKVGREGYHAQEVDVVFYSVDSDVNKLIYYIENSGKLFIISYDKNKGIELSENIFETILSTFDFS